MAAGPLRGRGCPPAALWARSQNESCYILLSYTAPQLKYVNAQYACTRRLRRGASTLAGGGRARRGARAARAHTTLDTYTGLRHARALGHRRARDVGGDARVGCAPCTDSHTQYRTVLVTLGLIRVWSDTRGPHTVCVGYRLRHTGHREVLPTATKCSVVRPLVQPLEALGHIAGRPAIQLDAPLWLQVWSGLVGCAVRHPQRVVLPVSQAREEQCAVRTRGRRL